MDLSPTRGSIAFADSRRIASGPLSDVARAARELLDAEPDATILVLDAATSEPIEVDLRGSAEDVAARLVTPQPAPRSPGRPKLGVVGREVTLLPRHWEWLGAQPGGASVTLRRLVDDARRSSGDADRVRLARESAYRFMVALAGDRPGFEDASRALFAGDAPGFADATAGWPADVREHARDLEAAGR
jgi:uncharacterized protein